MSPLRDRCERIAREMSGLIIELRDRQMHGHADAVTRIKSLGYDPRLHVEQDLTLRAVLDAIGGGAFSHGESDRYRGVVDTLLHRDTYMLLADFADYLATQARVDALYRDPAAWAKRALLNIAAMGQFSSDRTIREYVQKIWTAPTR